MSVMIKNFLIVDLEIDYVVFKGIFLLVCVKMVKFFYECGLMNVNDIVVVFDLL